MNTCLVIVCPSNIFTAVMRLVLLLQITDVI